MRLSHGFGARPEPRVLAALSRRLCFTATPLPASLQLRGREGDTDGDTGGVTRGGVTAGRGRSLPGSRSFPFPFPGRPCPERVRRRREAPPGLA